MSETADLPTGSSSMDSKHNAPAALHKPQVPSQDEDDEYPPFSTVIITIAALMLTSLCVSLDRTIIATAIPVITDHFDSLGDVGWYASAYLLTMSAFMLFMGRVYKFYNPKWVYIGCVAVFELGSLVCGVAPNSTALIVGRAIAGLGSAGVMSGAITIVVYLVPLQKRPAYTGMFGGVMAVAFIAGPLLGGVFTDSVSWRWCFLINLPLGGATMVMLAFVLKLNNYKPNNTPFKEQLHQLDPLGTFVLIPAVTCLLLALQWGGTKYSWSNARIIVLLILSGMLLIVFAYIQHWRQERATIPPRIIKNRSVASGMAYVFCSGSGMMTASYFLPIWFQAIKGASAVHSGIMFLPAILGLTVSSMFAGFATRKIGYYTQFMFLSSVLTSIGAGLICTFTTTTSHEKWIGYQVLWGLGLGFGMQQPSVAAQTALSRPDVSTGVSLMFFCQTLGGAIFVSVANNIFDNKLAQGLAGIPGLNADLVAHVGATDLRDVVAPEYLHSVLVVYNEALRNAFYVCAALAVATIVGAVFMPWKSLKKAAAEQQAQAKADRDNEKNKRVSVSGSAGTDARAHDGIAAQEQKELEV
ncbi:hypothetical protein LTS15_008030 [Exophiala xenobiotica]|nr:hypothetical protein LTS15_008030 [Exophiala xenobiotica]